MRIVAMSALALLGLSWALLPAAAQAGLIITTRSGTECVKLNDPTPDIQYSATGAYNNATSTVTYACPVDAHFLSTDTSYYFDTAYWWAYVDDNNASGNVTCQLNSCTDTGTCTSSVTRSSTGVANNQLLSTVGTVFNIGTYTNALFLRCTVPAKVGANRSGIRKYTTYTFD